MNMHFRLKNHLLLVALAAAYPTVSYAAGAARIEFVSGNVVAITPAGVQRALARGAELQSGEAIHTGDNARAQLRFSDGAMMSLQPQTQFRIDEYNYAGKLDGQERSFFSLIKGGLRTITGLVGKGNRDNYKVSTSVATIGIRGTEYSTTYSGGDNGVLNLATGEGAVQVCNSGGCVTITSGESAVVTGITPPTKSLVPPKTASAPISTTEPAKTDFSAAETTTETGRLALFGADLASGSDYVVAAVSRTGSQDPSHDGGEASATFGAGSKLQAFTNNYDSKTYTAGTVVSAFSVDGVIGWGYWSSGSSSYGSGTPLSDLHYVVGKPTDLASLSNLSGSVGTYTLIGYTTPTSTLGYTGSNVTGGLTADFASGNVDASISMNMNGQTVSGSGSGNISGANFSISGSLSGSGFFAGANASHAGLAYTLDGSGQGLGTISGAAGFKQTNVAPSSYSGGY